MKVISKAPIYYNAGGGDAAAKAGLITAGIGAAATLGSSLASRQKRPLSDIEQRCGKKPVFGFTQKGKDWKKCAESGTLPAAPITTPTQSKSNTKWILIGLGALVLLGGTVYLIRRNG